MTKLWGGRFTRDTETSVEEFTSSISFDQRMYRQDILGSMAHARMLGRCEILTQTETELIIAGLRSILADIEAGQFTFEIALEDIHMNIEKRLPRNPSCRRQTAHVVAAMTNRLDTIGT